MAIEDYLYGNEQNPVSGNTQAQTNTAGGTFTAGGGAHTTTVTPGNADANIANWSPGKPVPAGYEVYQVNPNQVSIRKIAGYTAPAASGGGTQNFGNLSDPTAWMALVGNDASLKAWIKQNNPGWSDDLVNYYAGVIKGQPGANASEQAGSAQYYLNKFKQDPFYGGSGGGGGGYGSLWNTLPTAEQLQQNPGFQYGMDEALRGLQAGAAARGTLLNGRTQQAISQNLLNYALGQQYIPLADLQYKYNQGNVGNLKDLATLWFGGSSYLNS